MTSCWEILWGSTPNRRPFGAISIQPMRVDEGHLPITFPDLLVEKKGQHVPKTDLLKTHDFVRKHLG